jgi:hypothetical protein
MTLFKKKNNEFALWNQIIFFRWCQILYFFIFIFIFIKTRHKISIKIVFGIVIIIILKLFFI